MSEPVADTSVIVDYSLDKWLVNRVPWALWFIVAGLAIVLHAEGNVWTGAPVALVYLALLGLAFGGWALTTVVDRKTSFVTSLAIGLVVIVVLAFIVGLVTGTVGRSIPRGTLLWSSLVQPPPDVFGWMLMDLGLAYVALVTYWHHRPLRPVVRLSPAGVTIYRSWLRDVLIPWEEIIAIGHLELPGTGPTARLNPNAVVVVTSLGFYARHVAPKRRAFAPPGSEMMFRQTGDRMQIVLTSEDVEAKPEEYLEALQARWQAYKAWPANGADRSTTAAQCVTYGRWSPDGSWWQTFRFGAPIAAIAVVLVHKFTE